MDNTFKPFTNLIAWQKSIELVKVIYKLSKSFPKDESFVLTPQIRRAVISVPSNIAEAFGRRNTKERSQFLYIAQGSLTELKTQIYISKELNYIKEIEFNDAMNLANEVHRLLQGLITKFKQS